MENGLLQKVTFPNSDGGLNQSTRMRLGWVNRRSVENGAGNGANNEKFHCSLEKIHSPKIEILTLLRA